MDVGSRLRNVGVAAGWLDPDGLVIDEVSAGASLPGRGSDLAVEAVADWLCERVPTEGAVLLALDAPLGWPRSLAAGLSGHAAGRRIPATDGADRLWRRATDAHVHARFGKLPLEVGANFIARTAWVALEILHAVRARSGRSFGLILCPNEAETGVLETYPAATLRAWLADDPGRYKARDPAPRRALLERLQHAEAFSLDPDARLQAVHTDHSFDAMICVLAAADFAAGLVPAVPSELRGLARQEGWIHVR